jgi:hypothetical protein
VVGQISLGDEAFIHRAQRASRRTADPEIPRQQRQPAWLSPAAVLQQVARRLAQDQRFRLRVERCQMAKSRPD